MDNLNCLGQLLFNLYRLTKEAAPSHFQREALELIKSFIPFDAAAWATGIISSGEVIPHTVHLEGVREDFLRTWEECKHEDHLIHGVMTTPGITFNVRVRKEFAGTQILENHCKPNHMEQILCTSEVDSLTGLYNVIAIYRSDPDVLFSEHERAFMQVVVPHLCETWKTIRIERFRQHYLHNDSSQWASAITDHKGVLHVADHRFVAMMQREWCAWDGTHLPRELNAIEEAKNTFRGKRITIKSEPVKDFVLLSARERTAIDALSRREMEIAQRFSEGKSHKEIATELDISPATVRTHLSTVYNKMQIRSKIELATLLR